MYQVLESYQRFNQKNSMIFRPYWDPSQQHIYPLNKDTQLNNIERDVVGFGLKDYSLAAGMYVTASSLGTYINQPNSGLTSWKPLPLGDLSNFPEEKPAISDQTLATGLIKRFARYCGADLVGIAKLDMRWVYSHHYILKTKESKPVEIDQHYKYVIAMAVAMNYNMIKTAPSAVHMAETFLAYSKMAFLVSSVAQFIRQIGYNAIPSLNDTALNVPIAIDSGLGQLGRIGILLTPQFGPRQRLCKVITDLPLNTNKPIDFGVTEFCSICRVCARECPGQAISHGNLTYEVSSISNSPGVMKWPLAAEKCRGYWSKIGTNCGVCMRVCPFNKMDSLAHNIGKWLVKHMPQVDSTLVRLDKMLGYGKYLNPESFWNA